MIEDLIESAAFDSDFAIEDSIESAAFDSDFEIELSFEFDLNSVVEIELVVENF